MGRLAALLRKSHAVLDGGFTEMDTRTYTHIHVHIHIHIHIHTHTHTHTYIHIRMHTYTHTHHTNTNTYIYTQQCGIAMHSTMSRQFCFVVLLNYVVLTHAECSPLYT